jgi:hypothetical protein
MFILIQIDDKVKTLDGYGLQFDNAWIEQYSKLSITTFGLMLLDVGLATYILFFREQPKTATSQPETKAHKQKQQKEPPKR